MKKVRKRENSERTPSASTLLDQNKEFFRISRELGDFVTLMPGSQHAEFAGHSSATPKTDPTWCMTSFKPPNKLGNMTSEGSQNMSHTHIHMYILLQNPVGAYVIYVI